MAGWYMGPSERDTMDDAKLRGLYTTAVEAAENVYNGDIEGVYDALLCIADALWTEMDKRGMEV